MVTTIYSRKHPKSNFTITLLLAGCAIFLVVGIITYPEQAFLASLQGLSLWWEIVFPAMLPFLILSEMMIAFGVMHFLGVWLESFMRTLLFLPGRSSWALSMVMTAGYPAGARTTALMREQGWITREEGERLLAYSYLCSPIFIISVVAVGFFRNVSLGWTLLGLHIGAWVLALMISRFILLRQASPSPNATVPKGKLFTRAIYAMNEAQQEDGRSFGKLMGDAVAISIQTMFIIGGYMMLFSVIIEIAEMSGIIPALVQGVQYVFYALGIPANVIQPLITGMLEIHLGAHGSGSSDIPPAWQAATVGAVLAWGGWSAHAQVKSITYHTDLSLIPYLKFRLLHSSLVFILTLLLWEPLLYSVNYVLPSFDLLYSSNGPQLATLHFWQTWPYGLISGVSLLFLLSIGAIIYWCYRTLRKHT